MPFLVGVRQLDVQGEFKEPLSQLGFPERLLGWDRTVILKYPDPGGHSITFEFKEGGATLAKATVYIYPQVAGMPASLREHLAGIVTEMHELRPDMEVVKEQDLPIDNDGRTIQNRLATLLYRAGYPPYREPAIGFLQLAKLDDYWLKWRITCPASACDDMPPRMSELMSALLPRR